jgi:predicted nucleic-acid-binding Zn-ribbon protein
LLVSGAGMPCRACSSDNLEKLNAEFTASFSSLKDVNVNPIYVCQEMRVCLDCGFAELRVPHAELEVLRKAKKGSAS